MIDRSNFASKRQKKRSDYAVYRTSEGGDKPKYYALDMFPYPSGAGLHVGHPKGYIATDVVSRQKKLAGYNVLHPMGFDSFGLPTENYAMKNKIHPSVATDQNISVFIDQLKKIGFNYDRDRMVSTADPEFYKRTQWMFIQLYEHRYDSEAEKARPIAELKSLLGMKEGKNERMKDNTIEKKYTKVLILDGVGGDGKSNWIPRLQRKLRSDSYDVQVPMLPANTKEDLDLVRQIDFMISEYGDRIDAKTLIVGHSLGCVLALHIIQVLQKKIDTVFVAPCFDGMDRQYAVFTTPRFADYEEALIHYYGQVSLDRDTLSPLVRQCTVMLSTDDPHIPYNDAVKYFKKYIPDCQVETFIDKGHFNIASGCLELPEMFDYLKPTRYLIFDYDGVLADTFAAVCESRIEMGDSTSPEEAIAKTLDYANKKPYHAKGHNLTDEEIKKMHTWMDAYTQVIIHKNIQLFDDFIEEIKKIPCCKIAIVSSNARFVIEKFLAGSGLSPTHILGFESDYSKEEKIQQICRDRGCDISDAYYFGDSQSDVYELQDMITPGKLIGCGWGFSGYDALCEVMPKECVMKEFDEIHAIVEGKNPRSSAGQVERTKDGEMNVIIVHGSNPTEESAQKGQPENLRHRKPWLKDQLERHGISVSNDLYPRDRMPDYNAWKEVFEKNTINENTILVGHSAGSAFILRRLGDMKRKVQKVILVAPSITKSDKYIKGGSTFKDFTIDRSLQKYFDELIIFYSDNDPIINILENVEKVHSPLGGKLIDLPDRGHFFGEGMGVKEFPELLDEILQTTKIPTYQLTNSPTDQSTKIPIRTLHKSHYQRDEAKVAKLLAEHSHSEDGYVDVTCAYIRGADGRIVLQHLVQSNIFVFPGGKVDKGETVEQAFVRECQEEVGITPTDYTLFGVCKIIHQAVPYRLWYYDVTGYDGEVTNLEPSKHDLQYARIEPSDNKRGIQIVLDATIVSDADELSNTFRDIILCEKDFRDPRYKIEEWIDAPVAIKSQDREYVTLFMDMEKKCYIVANHTVNHKQELNTEIVFIRDEQGVVEYTLQDGIITESYRREGGKMAHLDKETKLQNSVCSIIIHPDGNKVLLAFRKKTNWILFPGGGIDGNEISEQTARREVMEETGYNDILSVESFSSPIKKHHYHPPKGYNVNGTDEVCIVQLGSLQQQEVSPEEQAKHNMRWIDMDAVYDTLNSPLHKLFRYRWLNRDNKNLSAVDKNFLAQLGERIEYASHAIQTGKEFSAYHSRCRKQSLSDKENFHTLTDEEKIDRYIDTEKRLAFISHAPINWCPSCMTALANEDLDGNVCERCGTTIERRKMRQWMIRITDYAQRLLDGLDLLPERQDNIKAMQRHWIGRSEGTIFTFQVAKHSLSFDVYTTRIDTVYGVTFVSLAPEHALVEQITTDTQRDAVMAYVEETKSKTDIQRQEAKEKTGVWTGAYAVNPFTNEQIPIRVADYVLMDYGTGAVMAVPAHDERDWEFAEKFGLEVKQVVGPIVGTPHDDSHAKDSAYGLIYNNDKTKILVVWRGSNTPEMYAPGGTIDEGETLEIALRREIQEETGLKQFTLEGDPIFFQAHYFVDKKEGRENFWRCNNSHVFVCIASKEDLGDLQLTDDEKDVVTTPQWLSVEEFQLYIEKLGDDSVIKNAYQMLTQKKAMTDKGILVNSGPFTGMASEEAIPAMQARLDERGIGKKKINYRIQDRVFSRQRYRGEPIPMLYVPKRKVHELRFRDTKRRDALGVVKTIETRAGNPDEKERFFGNIAVGDIIAAKYVETGAYKHFLVTKTYYWKQIRDLRDAGEETMQRIYSSGNAPVSLEQLVSDFEATSPDYADRLHQHGLYGFAIEKYDIATDISSNNYQIRPMSSDELPLTLPDVAHYEPTGTEEGPLAKISEWIDQVLPDGTPARRESNTMPGWAGSSWYWIRYMDPRNANAVVSPEVEAYRGQVDLYVGGMEHACRHLIYARFRHKFLKDIAVVTTEEPFKRLKGVGLVLAEDGRKMSKRRGNVINPDDVIAEFGTDAFRSYEMFMGPFESEVARSTAGVKGVKRFLDKVVKISEKVG